MNDAVSPRLSVRVRRTPALSVLLARGLAVRLRCSERSTVRVVLRFGRHALTQTLRVSLTPATSRRVMLRLTRTGRRALRRHPSALLSLRARAVDAAGNSRSVKVGLRASR